MLVTTLPRHMRRYCVMKNSSGLKRASGSSFDEAPSGQVQEDVLERAAPDHDALGDEPALVQPVGRRVAVVRVQQHAVRERLDALDQPVRPVAEIVRPAPVVEAELDDLPVE